MPKQLSPDRRRELDELFAVSAVIAAMVDAEIATLAEEGFSRTVTRTYEMRDLTGMRLIHADLTGGFLPTFSPTQRRELDRRLRAGPGVTLDSVEVRQLERIARVRARGRITTEQQYYMLRERVEVIWDDPERQEEFRSLQELLNTYEDRAAARARRQLPNDSTP